MPFGKEGAPRSSDAEKNFESRKEQRRLEQRDFLITQLRRLLKKNPPEILTRAKIRRLNPQLLTAIEYSFTNGTFTDWDEIIANLNMPDVRWELQIPRTPLMAEFPPLPDELRQPRILKALSELLLSKNPPIFNPTWILHNNKAIHNEAQQCISAGLFPDWKTLIDNLDIPPKLKNAWKAKLP